MSKKEKMSRLLCRVWNKVAIFQTRPLFSPGCPKTRVIVPDDLGDTRNKLSASEDVHPASARLLDLFWSRAVLGTTFANKSQLKLPLALLLLIKPIPDTYRYSFLSSMDSLD